MLSGASAPQLYMTRRAQAIYFTLHLDRAIMKLTEKGGL